LSKNGVLVALRRGNGDAHGLDGDATSLAKSIHPHIVLPIVDDATHVFQQTKVLAIADVALKDALLHPHQMVLEDLDEAIPPAIVGNVIG
jgi:hypothetical protein